jgi:hydrogenase maturation protease
MLNLREQLQQCFRGRVCLLGLGNMDYGDDGFGVRLAEALDFSHDSNPSIPPIGPIYTVINAGTAPERLIGRVADGSFDHVIFLDAVDFGGSPGAAVFLNAERIAARFPQISTHKLSLGLLARQVEASGRTKAWLLGVQPESLKPGPALSPTVQTTLQLLREILCASAGLPPRHPSTTPPPRSFSVYPEVTV